MASTSTTIPGRSSDCSVSSSAASRLIPRSIGTRSYGDPWNACSRCRSSDTSPPVIRATRARIRLADGPGRSAGRTFTVHDGVLTATGRPARSKINPRGAGTGTSTVRSAAARRANSSPCTTCSWKRRPPSAVMSTIAATPNAMNRGPRAGQVVTALVQVGHELTMPAPRQRRSDRATRRAGYSRSPAIAAFSVAAARIRSIGTGVLPASVTSWEIAERDEVGDDRPDERGGDRIDPSDAADHPRATGDHHRHDEHRERDLTRAERPRADSRSNRP